MEKYAKGGQILSLNSNSSRVGASFLPSPPFELANLFLEGWLTSSHCPTSLLVAKSSEESLPCPSV